MKKVESSAISKVHYLKDKRILQLQFVSGSIYHYFAVPESIYIEFINSDSLGHYFSTHIRDKGFEFRRIK